MRELGWTVAYIAACAVLVFLLIAPYLGFEASPDPLVVASFALLLGFLFTRRGKFTGRDGDG